MHYRTFLMYNVVGAILWVVSLTLAGYFFGSIPVIKENFELAVLGIIALSLLPMVIEFIKHKLSSGNPETTTSEEPVDYQDIQKTFKNLD